MFILPILIYVYQLPSTVILGFHFQKKPASKPKSAQSSYGYGGGYGGGYAQQGYYGGYQQQGYYWPIFVNNEFKYVMICARRNIFEINPKIFSYVV